MRSTLNDSLSDLRGLCRAAVRKPVKSMRVGAKNTLLAVIFWSKTGPKLTKNEKNFAADRSSKDLRSRFHHLDLAQFCLDAVPPGRLQICKKLGLFRAFARLGSRQAQLHHVGAAGAETGFAVAEVEAPQPAEAFVEAQGADVVPGRLEATAPLGQGGGVVLAEPGDGLPLQARAIGFLPQAGFAGEHAAREDVFAHEVRVPAIDREQFVADGDDLQAGAATGREDLADLGEIGRPIGFAHRLEHLDRGDAVEMALDVSVIR